MTGIADKFLRVTMLDGSKWDVPEIENIISRLTAAGVQADEKEKQEIYTRFRLLVDERFGFKKRVGFGRTNGVLPI